MRVRAGEAAHIGARGLQGVGTSEVESALRAGDARRRGRNHVADYLPRLQLRQVRIPTHCGDAANGRLAGEPQARREDLARAGTQSAQKTAQEKKDLDA